MNRTTIKNFAIWARNHLREQVSTRATQLAITEKTITDQRNFAGGLLTGEQTLNSQETIQYQELQSHIKYLLEQQVSKNLDKQLNKQADRVLDILVEEIAYTWFNRLVALRFMEVKGYIGRVLSSSDRNLVDPDILRDRDSIADTGEIAGINQQTLKEWEDLASQQTNPEEYLYRQLLLAQCQALSSSIPALFDTRYPALLLPINLLGQDSIIGRLVKEIAQEDWEDIEIVGWLYQFYISERKDQVIGAKSKVEAKDIPAATQLFTPRWIVQYMVENSLGRLWLENHPQSKLREKMPYYLEGEKIRGGEEQEESKVSDTAPLLGLLMEKVSPGIALTPEELTVIDPACGSGHILVYAFDLLMEIYKEQGYLEKDIPGLILNHNLYGLDIDERAVQLASFAVLMKARAINKRIFRNAPALNIKTVRCTRGYKLPITGKVIEKDWQPLLDAFVDADNLGSLITPPSFGGEVLRKQLKDLELSNPILKEKDVPFLDSLIRQAELLTNKYWVVVANPPYMGNKSFNETIKSFIEQYYKKSKGDLFAVFMKRTIEMTKNYGFMSAINQQSWMFLSTYEELRKDFLIKYAIDSMVHLGARTFPEIGGEVVQSTAFVFHKQEPINRKATYVRLVDYNDSELKRQNFLSGKHRYSGVNQADFAKIPGSAIAYWVSERVLEIFQESKPLNDIASPCVGLQTGNNDRFLRLWTEVNINNIGFGLDNREAAKKSGKKWFPYNKGGEFRKWYGNQQYVVNWENDGFEIRNFGIEYGMKPRSRPQNTDKYFKESVSWSKVTSSYFSLRFYPQGFIFADAGMSIFSNDGTIIKAILGVMNSPVMNGTTGSLSPTLNFEVGQISSFPILNNTIDTAQIKITENIDQAINISRQDWDNLETSWDFLTHPLLRHNSPSISQCFTQWQNQSETAFRQLQLLEEENNRYWIQTYGLETELTPEVPEDQITINRADQQRDIRSLLSYIVGCIMGRYSLDKPGIIHAGNPFDPSLHQQFPASNHAIIPITDQTYFTDDIITRFEEFIQIAYSPDTCSENLKFIAETLTLKNGESPRERIRRYFLQEFISDHIQTYKKRPIYWLFTSGKKRAFNALIYLHRYQEDTLARMRTEYVLELQIKLEGEITKYQKQLEISTNSADKKNASKRLKELQDQQSELAEYQEKLQHLADARIKLDLDDGVAYNYTRFKGLVYEGSDLKMADLEKASQWKK